MSRRRNVVGGAGVGGPGTHGVLGYMQPSRGDGLIYRRLWAGETSWGTGLIGGLDAVEECRVGGGADLALRSTRASILRSWGDINISYGMCLVLGNPSAALNPVNQRPVAGVVGAIWMNAHVVLGSRGRYQGTLDR